MSFQFANSMRAFRITTISILIFLLLFVHEYSFEILYMENGYVVHIWRYVIKRIEKTMRMKNHIEPNGTFQIQQATWTKRMFPFIGSMSMSTQCHTRSYCLRLFLPSFLISVLLADLLSKPKWKHQNLSIQHFTWDLHNWPTNFDFTVHSECRFRWTHFIAGTTVKWISANDSKSITIQNKQSFRSSCYALQIRVLNVWS